MYAPGTGSARRERHPRRATIATTKIEATIVKTHAHQWTKYGMSTSETRAARARRRRPARARARPTKRTPHADTRARSRRRAHGEPRCAGDRDGARLRPRARTARRRDREEDAAGSATCAAGGRSRAWRRAAEARSTRRGDRGARHRTCAQGSSTFDDRAVVADRADEARARPDRDDVRRDADSRRVMRSHPLPCGGARAPARAGPARAVARRRRARAGRAWSAPPRAARRARA